MAEPTIQIKSTTPNNIAITLDDGSASTSVTSAGTSLTKEFLLCAAFRQALIDHRVEIDVDQPLTPDQLVMGRGVIKSVLGALQHSILNLHHAATTAKAALDERKAAFNDQRSTTELLLTQSQQLGPGADHLHAAAEWLLRPTTESAEVMVIEQQIADKKVAIIGLDASSANRLDSLLAELKVLEAQRTAALHHLLLHPSQQEWLQLQAALAALKDAAAFMMMADPATVPAAIP